MEFLWAFIGFFIGMVVLIIYVMAAPAEKVIWELKEENEKLTKQVKLYETQLTEQLKVNRTTAEYNKSLDRAVAEKTKRKLQLEKDILTAEAELNALNELLAERKKEFFDEWSKSKGGHLELEDNSKD